MITILFIFFFTSFIPSILYSTEVLTNNNRQIIDKIDVSILNQSNPSIIFYSDYWFPVPTGILVSPEELIIKQLWLKKADDHNIKIGMPGTEDYAEKYFDLLQEEKNVSREQINAMCREIGYTINDIKRELNEQSVIQQIIELTLTANGSLHVSLNDMIYYCKENPKIEEPIFTIQKKILSPNQSEYTFYEPLILKKSELSSSFSNIEKFDIGDSIFETAQEDQKVIYTLLSKIPEKIFSTESRLDEDYEEIFQKIQAHKYKIGYKEAALELLNSSDILFSDNTMKEKIKNYIENN